MREAARISSDAFKRIMKFCKPGAMEYQLEAELQHEFAMQARQHLLMALSVAVVPMLAFCTTPTTETLHDGDLVLVDAGAEYQGYAADITRTFPINGRFSEEQAMIYNIVLKAQQAAFAHIKPGDTSQGGHRSGGKSH